MLKTVSSITNAIGALNFKGAWNASTNTPTLASGVGTKGDYFVVGVAGTTTLDGISTWGVGDWATYNGGVWQRVEGGADLEGVNLNVSGTTNLAALTASTALALDASKNVVSVTNTGSGSNVLATSPSLTTPNIGAASGTSLGLTGAMTAGSVNTYALRDFVAAPNIWNTLGAVGNDQIWRVLITDSNTTSTWQRADDLYLDKTGNATFKNIYDVNPGFSTRELRVSGGNLQFRVVGSISTANTVTAMRVA